MKIDAMAPLIDIIIPTFNRAHLITNAIRGALDQSWWNVRVIVVDDASTDQTIEVVRPFFSDARFNYIRLGKNLGTANAKNAGLLLTGGDAVTFHDSDDLPHRDKVLHQVRIITASHIGADECLNWKIVGKVAGQTLQVGAALTHHELILPDGRRVPIRRDLSLFDDVFPNTQMGTQVPGEWTHINSGLFHADVFKRIGGFEDCIEEDREFRNRLIMNGEIVWIIPELLLTKIETTDSLTQSTASDYDSDRRKAERLLVWDRVDTWRKTGGIPPVAVDIPDLAIDFVSNAYLLSKRDIIMTATTSARVDAIMSSFDYAGIAAQ